MWSPCGSESVFAAWAGRSIGFVWLENARASSRPRALSAPPTSLVRSNFGAYCGAGSRSVSGCTTGVGLVATGVGRGVNSGEFIGSVGSNNPGPSIRFTGADASREVRRGNAVVLFEVLRAGFTAGLTIATVGFDATNKRGDFSRRSSNDQPRGKVSRVACSPHNRLRWRCSSAS